METSISTPEFIYFDLGRVLLTFDHEIAVRQLATLGSVPRDKIRDVVFEGSLQAEYERGDISTEEFCRRLRAETGIKQSDADICQAASDIFVPNQPVIEILEELYLKQWPLGLLSNTCDAHWQWIEQQQYSFLNRLEPLVLSFRAGVAKPESEIYEIAIERVGLLPRNIFFVDDLPANVAGAKAAGLDAVLYSTPTQLLADLAERGINITA